MSDYELQTPEINVFHMDVALSYYYTKLYTTCLRMQNWGFVLEK